MAELLRARYEVLELLGGGGEARVVKALDRQHDRTVALKIRPTHDDDDRTAMLGEARLLLAVPPHPLLPLVREDFFEGASYVIAMDWVDGTDLAEILASRGRPGLAPSSVLAYLADAAEALTHLHTQDPPVIHGDIKPGNLILTTGGRVKLVDFGMSSSPSVRWRRIGTPGFRAPELASGDGPSRASDVYSLAATAFALFTGAPPSGRLPSWDGIDARQAEQIEAALRLGLATNPTRRPATPGELVERLRAGWAEALPTGVVTFCLSDIEASTELWEAAPDEMARALVRHDELIADTVAAHGGRLIKSMGEGDSTVSVFDSATRAVDAVVATNAALGAEAWPGDLELRVRFGLHTGEAERRGADYFGPSVNLAARLRSQADGGQVLLSPITADLVRPALPDGFDLVDLGPHRLKGINAPQRLFAVRGPGVRAPLPATECPYRGLLAFEAEDRDLFFGRDQVLEKLLTRVEPGRLVALVGASGSGKTSLLRAGLIAAVRAGEVPGLDEAALITPGGTPEPVAVTRSTELLVVDQFEELFTQCHERGARAAFIDSLLAAGAAVVIGVRADFYGQLTTHPELARAVEEQQVLLGAMTDDELRRAVTEPARLGGLRFEAGLIDIVVRDVAGEPGALPLLSHALLVTWEHRDGRTLTVEGYHASGGVRSAVAHTADQFVATLPEDERALLRQVFLRLTEVGDGADDTRRRVDTNELVPATVSSARVHALLERLAEARLVTLGEGTAEVSHEVLIREWPTLRQWLEEDRASLRLHRRLGDAAQLWNVGGREPSDLYRGTRLDAAREWAAGHAGQLNAVEGAFLDASVAHAEDQQRAQQRSNRRLRRLLVATAAMLVIAVVAAGFALVQRRSATQEADEADVARLVSTAQSLAGTKRDVALLLAIEAARRDPGPATTSALLAALYSDVSFLGYLRTGTAAAGHITFSADGRHLIANRRLDGVQPVRVELDDGSVSTLPVELDDATGVSWVAPVDDSTVVVARNHEDPGHPVNRLIERVDLTDGRATASTTLPGVVEHIAISPDRTSALVTTVGRDDLPGHAVVVDLATMEPVASVEQPGPPIGDGPYFSRSAWVDEDLVAVGSPTGRILLWEPATGAVRQRVNDPPSALPGDAAHLEVSADRSTLIAASAFEPAVMAFDIATGAPRWPRPVAAGITTAIDQSAGVVWAQEAGDGSSRAFAYDLATGERLSGEVDGQHGSVCGLAISPDRATIALSSCNEGTIGIWALDGRTATGDPLAAARWEVPRDAWSADGRYVAVVDPEASDPPMIVDVRDGSQIEAPNMWPLAFRPDGTVQGVLANRHLVVFHPVEGTTRDTGVVFSSPPEQTAAPGPGGLSVFGHDDGTVTVIDVEREQIVREIATDLGPIFGVGVSADGLRVFAAGQAEEAHVYDVGSGERIGTLAPAANITVSPDGELLATAAFDGSITFYDAATLEPSGDRMTGATAFSPELQFTPDGRTLVTGSLDSSLRLFDVASRRQIGVSIAVTSSTFAIAPDSTTIAIRTERGVQRLAIDAAILQRAACRAASRNLTADEWRQHIGGTPRQLCREWPIR